MSEELDVLKVVTGRLDDAGISYMVCGSIAANYYTTPRMTRDIDMVIELEPCDIDKFVGLFEKDFYVDRKMVAGEVSRRGMFNLIHNQSVVKIDLIVKKSSAYDQAEFSRRTRVLVGQSLMWFVSPEDLIISKLIWARSSHSEMQLRDVANLMRTVKHLDMEYISRWIRELDLEQTFKEARNE